METITTTYDKVKALRSEGAALSEINFKKAAFGGFECGEVLEYIKTLRSNMQLSERAFNDKLEEYSNLSAMYMQEREKMVKEVKGQAEEIRLLKAKSLETMERSKTAAQTIEQENAELKNQIELMQKQIERSEQSKKIEREIGDLAAENKRLTEELMGIGEAKEKLESRHRVAEAELIRLRAYNEKLTAEITALKKNESRLKTAKRSLAMGINMQVFEYQQKLLLDLERAGESLADITRVCEAMREGLTDFAQKSKIGLQAEEAQE